jgi:alkanesulfonate monooxygenase SsuD/methylene tetrahydromethanopterin reductase-like flavin-dependent oxidoreductase (luciferase family)
VATPLRPPPVVAKMAESLDRLSGGRLILGLDGGSMDEELTAFGLGARLPRDKVDGLEETIRILRGMWSQERFSFSGRLYRTEGAQIEPNPDHPSPSGWAPTATAPWPSPAGLPMAGFLRSASPPPSRSRPYATACWAAARAAGRDPAEITCAYNLAVRVDEHAKPEPDTVSGPPEAVAERLLGFLELGFTALNFIPIGPDPTEQSERLAREVSPTVRAGVQGQR